MIKTTTNVAHTASGFDSKFVMGSAGDMDICMYVCMSTVNKH